MIKTDIITINGTQYDAVTGMPIADQGANLSTKPQLERKTQPAATLHNRQQRSATLQRKVALKHTTMAQPKLQARQQQPRRSMDIARSPSISKFAPMPIVEPVKTTVKIPADRPAVPHPMVQKSLSNTKTRQAIKPRMNQATTQAQPAPHKPAQVLKEEAIAKAFAASHSSGNKKHKTNKSLSSRFPRFFSIASASMAIVLLAGYFTYLNIPTVSIRIAAAQSGIDATYPSYKPDGYRLSGPIAHTKNGEVSMKFAANAGPQNFTLTEKRSSWDSSAVLDNHIKPVAGDKYTTHTEGGLTIYTYGAQAAWVNRGILYTIDGSAPLSDSQIRRIATSL